MNKTVMDHAIALDENVRSLNSINSSYNRYCGTLYMASKEMEDRIEALLKNIRDDMVALNEATDSDIAEFTDDVTYYREFLEQLEDVIAANEEAVKKAREFLGRYGQ